MQTHTRLESLRSRLQTARCAGEKIALVPTMGNLHAGHLALVEKAKTLAERVVVSIFINPMQFAPSDDLARYPRTLAADLSALRRCDVDEVLIPPDDEMYPEGMDGHTQVEVPDLSSGFCGAQRPRHFAGVSTIVTKLLFIAQPHFAVFGEKDYQQLLIARRLAADLCSGTRIVGVPTVRAEDQLALSSRNHYLSLEERRVAPALHRCLLATAERLRQGERDYAKLERDGWAALRRAGFAPEYYNIADADDLQAVSDKTRRLLVLAAGTISNTRLIDNVTVTVKMA